MNNDQKRMGVVSMQVIYKGLINFASVSLTMHALYIDLFIFGHSDQLFSLPSSLPWVGGWGGGGGRVTMRQILLAACLTLI